MSLDVKYVLMADDLRDEITGKQTLVGVYNDSMNTDQLPAQLSQLVFRLTLNTVPSGKDSISFELRSPTGRVVQSLSGPLFSETFQSVEPDATAQVVMNFSPLRLDEVGEYSLVHTGGAEDQTVYSFTLNKTKALKT